MKILIQALFALLFASFISCGGSSSEQASTQTETTSSPDLGQAGVVDETSANDIVKIALGSADHTTLVKALQQADYVNDLANAGPFTVFAPVNAAFDKLPAGTLDKLMQNDQVAVLQDILEYHVAIGVYKEDMFRDGQTINMANTKNISIQRKDGKTTINNTVNILATVPATNGLVYVVDGVLLPPEN
jgi:uncharacterized surface protein with fasciclin (FAS1) repeats